MTPDPAQHSIQKSAVLVDGAYVSAPAITPPSDAASATVARVTRMVLDPDFRLPTLPAVASEVMRLANCSEVTFREVDKVVRNDPILAARILSVVNSPVFRPSAPVVSLRNAMMLLGWNVLREVLWQVIAEAHVFRGTGKQQLRTLRIHSIATAHIARLVCHTVGLNTDHAFVCGLLHDLGRPMTLRTLVQNPRAPLTKAQDIVIDQVHTLIGQRVAETWGLPEEVVRCTGLHHSTETTDPSVLSIRAAELIGYHFGLGDRQAPVDPKAPDPVFTTLGLSDTDITHLIARADELRAAI